LKLPSHPRCICEVENYVRDLVERLHIDENLYPNILICLTEAVNNAMIHGNQLDEQKEIMLSCHEKEHEIQFTISDEGSGFDPYKVPDPTSKERIETEGGRGVFLMKQLTDEIHFLNHGRTVKLMWKI
jgi:serine/threonine-protein kinase RsbW